MIVRQGKAKSQMSKVRSLTSKDRAAWLAELKALHRRYGAGKAKASCADIVARLREERGCAT